MRWRRRCIWPLQMQHCIFHCSIHPIELVCSSSWCAPVPCVSCPGHTSETRLPRKRSSRERRLWGSLLMWPNYVEPISHLELPLLQWNLWSDYGSREKGKGFVFWEVTSMVDQKGFMLAFLARSGYFYCHAKWLWTTNPTIYVL